MVTLGPTQPSPLLGHPEVACPDGTPPATAVRLPARFIWPAPANVRAIRCVAGLIWITQEGDPRDHVLAAGQSFMSDRSGKIVVQAMDDSTIRV